MINQKNNFKRKSIRLPEYNYSQSGFYFITICTENRKLLFGKMENNKMKLNVLGKIIKEEWLNIPNFYNNIDLDEFIVMPNHIHGIIIINPENVGAGLAPAQNNNKRATARVAPTRLNPNLGEIIGKYKSICFKKWRDYIYKNNLTNMPVKIWQRNYYERIIRSEDELASIIQYVRFNEDKWGLDRNNPIYF